MTNLISVRPRSASTAAGVFGGQVLALQLSVDFSKAGVTAHANGPLGSLVFHDPSSPFNGFTGTVTADGKVTVSGPQSCTGTATSSAISMSCTPGTCSVTLSR